MYKHLYFLKRGYCKPAALFYYHIVYLHCNFPIPVYRYAVQGMPLLLIAQATTGLDLTLKPFADMRGLFIFIRRMPAGFYELCTGAAVESSIFHFTSHLSLFIRSVKSRTYKCPDSYRYNQQCHKIALPVTKKSPP
jgi:hypothetical protein